MRYDDDEAPEVVPLGEQKKGCESSANVFGATTQQTSIKINFHCLVLVARVVKANNPLRHRSSGFASLSNITEN
jgi:hypothetical protein